MRRKGPLFQRLTDLCSVWHCCLLVALRSLLISQPSLLSQGRWQPLLGKNIVTNQDKRRQIRPGDGSIRKVVIVHIQDLSSIPGTHMEKPGVGVVHTGNSSMERPASLAYLLIHRTVKDLVSRKPKQKGEISSKISTCTHTHSHGHMRTHEHPHTKTTVVKTEAQITSA